MIKQLLLSASLLASGTLFGVTKDEAMSLYNKRNSGDSLETKRQNTVAARDAYRSLLSTNLSEEDRLFTITQIARTYVFEGEVLLTNDRREQRDVFEECSDFIEVINEDNLGYASEEYYYFKVGCLGLQAKASSVLRRLGLVDDLKKATEGAEALIKEYDGEILFEGGGVYRVLAFLYSADEAKGTSLHHSHRSNNHNPLAYIDLAIASDGLYDELYDRTIEGKFFADNYYVKAEVLRVLEKHNELDTLLENTVNNDGVVVQGKVAQFQDLLNTNNPLLTNRIAETHHAIFRMKESLAQSKKDR